MMVGDNRKHFSILIIALLILMVVAFNIALYLLYTRSVDTLDRSLGDRLLSVGRAISPEVERVLATDQAGSTLSLAAIVQLQDYLARIRDSDALSGVYFLDLDGRDLLSLDDSISDVQLILPLHIEGLSHAGLGNAEVSELYRADDRYFKSAYQPVGDNPVLGVLLIESSFEFFSEFQDFRQHIILVNAGAVGLLILVSIVIVILNRRLVKAERLLISRAALSQMGQMAAVIAHEVRNPLAIIKATAERLKMKYSSADSSDNQLFEFIPEEVDRLNMITTHYLQFASPIAARGNPESLDQIILSVTGGMAKEFEHKSVALKTNCEDQAGECLVDSQQIRQILVNLLNNALDATPSGGLVTIDAGISRPGSLLITVSDTGCGIDKKAIKHIFDPFSTGKAHGTGLGLFVVRRLVDNLKGDIRVESQLGIGTKFVLTLPGSADGQDSRS